MRRVLLLLFPFSVVCLACLAALPSLGTCGPLLNEMMGDPNRDWDGDGVYSSRNDEWVEIYNPGPGALDLEGYFLADDLGKPVYGYTESLPAGAVKVVYGGQSVAWESSHGQAATGLRLSNDGDTVELKQVVGPDTLLVDAYTYNTYEAEDDRASGRLPDGTDTWSLFDALNPYSGQAPPHGNGLPPTPGALNTGQGDPPTPSAEDTWGRIKQFYTPW